jgi:hypothetical protein
MNIWGRIFQLTLPCKLRAIVSAKKPFAALFKNIIPVLVTVIVSGIKLVTIALTLKKRYSRYTG